MQKYLDSYKQMISLRGLTEYHQIVFHLFKGLPSLSERGSS